tara:strand:- start:221 stop:388 length:168 start_codon:yes stop_codon:yes gene_type:complete
MNKKKISEIKKIINYDPSNPEQKRLLRKLKKQYQSLPENKKTLLILDLKKAFNDN